MDDETRHWLDKLIRTVDDVIDERRAADAERHQSLIENLEQLRERLAAKLRDMPR